MCRYDNGKCQLAELLKVEIGTQGDWCKDRCKSNNVIAQLAMLKQLGFVLPKPPKDKDLLEWAKECVEKRTVKMPPLARQFQKQKADQAKIIAELPSWFQQAKNLHKHAKQIAEHYKKTGQITVTPEQKAGRLAICDDCEKLLMNPKTGNKKCSGCGCNIVGLVGDKYGKADFEALKCDKWPAID